MLDIAIWISYLSRSDTMSRSGRRTRYAEANQLTLAYASRSSARTDWMVVRRDMFEAGAESIHAASTRAGRGILCRNIKVPSEMLMQKPRNQVISDWALFAVACSPPRGAEVDSVNGGNNLVASSTSSSFRCAFLFAILTVPQDYYSLLFGGHIVVSREVAFHMAFHWPMLGNRVQYSE